MQNDQKPSAPGKYEVGLTFSAVVFGVALGMFAENGVAHHSARDLVLAGLSFVKFVDSYWWYNHVIVPYSPPYRLVHWYWDFIISLSFLIMMTTFHIPLLWCLSLLVVSVVGGARILAIGWHTSSSSLRGAVRAVTYLGIAVGLLLVPILVFWRFLQAYPSLLTGLLAVITLVHPVFTFSADATLAKGRYGAGVEDNDGKS